MLTSSSAHTMTPPQRHVFVRYYGIIMLLALPTTLLALIGVAWLDSLLNNADVAGICAVSVGIIGILIFYIFFYKFQICAGLSIARRWLLLAVHAASTVALFGLVLGLGFYSPWARILYWGSYDIETAARSWGIAALVIGTITLLGSFFDLMRVIATRAGGRE